MTRHEREHRGDAQIAGTPSIGAMRVANVPFPTPGAPRKTSFISGALVEAQRTPREAEDRAEEMRVYILTLFGCCSCTCCFCVGGLIVDER